LPLEQELQAELEDAAQVRAGGLQETAPAAAGAGRIARGIIGATVAANRAIHAIPLGVIENVESLSAELERVGLFDREVLVKCHVEIQAAGNVQGIASGIAECETLRGGICGRIE
jgi:hypothetical protein